MELKNAPYYRMWQDRYGPFSKGNWCLYMEFSPGYFAKLKRELESAGYEVTIDENGYWHSAPVGMFGISVNLRGESFVFFAM